MGPSPSRFDPEQSALSPARARVLEAMQRTTATASAGDVARDLGLHENTARKHLEGLADRGLLERTPGASSGRGRPAFSYRALAQQAEPDARVRDYVGLVVALARHLGETSEDPAADSISAGERWAKELSPDDLSRPAAPAEPGGTRDADGQPAPKAPLTIHIVKAFDSMGFAPEVDDEDESIALTRCPLIDAVRVEPAVVCAVHLGVARGLVNAHGGDASRVRLTPFSEVGACRLHLT